MTRVEYFPSFYRKFKKLNKKNKNLINDIDSIPVKELISLIEKELKDFH